MPALAEAAAPSADDLKRDVGREAAALVRPGMRVGLGTGSTAAHFLRFLAARMASGDLPGVVGVPTSRATERAARGLGIPLGALAELAPLDLTVDGADEVDPGLEMIKGLGGALLREKMVAQASRKLVAIVDESKEVARLGERSPLPVEVASFEFESHLEWMAALGCEPRLRMEAGAEKGPERGGQPGEPDQGAGDSGDDAPARRPYRTDNGNLIVDCRFEGGIPDAAALEDALCRRAGVVESGLFLGMAAGALVAGRGGVRRRWRR